MSQASESSEGGGGRGGKGERERHLLKARGLNSGQWISITIDCVTKGEGDIK